MALDPITQFDLNRLRVNNFTRKSFKMKAALPSPPLQTIRILYGLFSTPKAKVFETAIQGGSLISLTQVGSTIEGTNNPFDGGPTYATDDGMGWSVSLSKDGNIAAISSPTASDTNYYSGNETGNVKVYEYDGASWSQKGSTLYAGETQDEALVGWSVDLSDDGLKLLVQSPGPADGDGNISAQPTYYVFESGDWVEKSRPNRNFPGGVRGQMSNDGRVIVITDPNAGYGSAFGASVWEYDLSSDSWSFREDISLGFQGGVGLDINSDGSRICSSSYNNTVKVYEWDGSSYNQMGSNIVGNSGNQAIFCRMNDAGDILAIAAPGAGVIRVYRWNGSIWVKDGTELNSPGSNIEISRTGDVIIGGTVNPGLSIFQYYSGDWNTVGSLATDIGPVTNSSVPGSIGLYGQFTIGLSEI